MAKKKSNVDNSQKLVYSDEFLNESPQNAQMQNAGQGQMTQGISANEQGSQTGQVEPMQNVKMQGNGEAMASQEKVKKERNWVINTGNMAILASSLSLAIDVVHKLLRMVLIASTGIIIFLYILAGILSVFALVASIKYGFKSKEITIDAYLTGISFVALILI